jgi:hypothetical protein
MRGDCKEQPSCPHAVVLENFDHPVQVVKHSIAQDPELR